ncbi:phosphoglucosamine mutase [Thiovulum sp. ES]|nr:phosphoglucosamine mutase [Thiovulum sp. ES]
MEKLFGTDGVRGKAGTELSAMKALKIAMSAGIFFKRDGRTGKILIGKDTRLSGYMIEDAIVSGLTAVGYDVIQVGPMPTPAVAFLTEDMRCDAGIMISASHNHFADNGIKFFDSHGNKLSEKLEAEIEDIYRNDDLLEASQQTGDKVGSSKRIEDAIGRYIVHLKHSFPKRITLTGLRIVLDTANGAGYKVGPTVFEELGAEVITINRTPNGKNINENCGALHPNNLSKEVIRFRADLGVALDGDADRLVVVDEQGEVVNGDHLIGALAIFLKESGKLKGNGVVATVMSNLGLEEFLKSSKITLHRVKVGDKYVLEKMRTENLSFGGEQSGHIVVSEFAKTGDGLTTALQVLAYMISKKRSASEILRPFQLYPQILKNLPVGKKIPLGEIAGLKDIIDEVEKNGMRHLIRYSGTENLLRVLLEGKDTKVLQNTIEKLQKFFEKALK